MSSNLCNLHQSLHESVVHVSKPVVRRGLSVNKLLSEDVKSFAYGDLNLEMRMMHIFKDLSGKSAQKV